MEELLQCVDHPCHDPRWSLVSPKHREPVCIACLLQLLQEPQLVILKKKIILSEFLGLLCQQVSDILCLLQGDLPVQSHIILTLVDLIHAEDQIFVSMAMEACLKLICQLKSENLVACTMDRITKECCQQNKVERCLPVLILLGRLLNDIPGLAEVLVHRYDGLVRELGNGLLCPVESTVSALVYIMIFVFSEDLQPHLPLKLCHQVHHSLIIHLARTDSQELQVNLLGLLQRNLLNRDFRTALLDLSLEGSTLLTCLKKLLMSSNDVLQMSAVQSCCLILAKANQKQHGASLLEADLAEVLFELLNRNDEKLVESVFKCLVLLTEVDEFFSRCHSVYGISSVLRVLNHLCGQRNPAPLREGLQLLTLILQRQPPSIPLFSSPADVKSCLVTIATGLGQPDGQVVALSLQAFSAFLRINHLGTPVPFREIGKTLELAGQKTGEIIQHQRQFGDSRRRESCRLTGGEKGKEISIRTISTLLLCLRQAVKVAEECVSQPTACEETYCPPHLTPGGDTALSSLLHHVLRCADEFCIPAVMIKWAPLSKSGDIFAYFSLLHQLHCVCPEKMLPLKCKLVSSGFFSSTLGVKSHYRSDEASQSVLDEVLLDFLTSLSLDLTQTPVDTLFVSETVREGLKQLHYKLPDCSRHLLDEDTPLSVYYVCLKMVFLCLWHDDICLVTEEIQSIIVSSLYHFPETSEWPPLAMTYLTFLTAWCYQAVEFDLGLHCRPGFESCLRWLSSNPLSSWYTDHPAHFTWAFSHPQLADVIGPAVLERWLTNLPPDCSDVPDDKEADVEGHEEGVPAPGNQAPLIFSTVMTNGDFRNAVQTLLLRSTSQDILERLVLLVTAVISQSNGENDIIQHWAMNSLPHALQSVLLSKEHIKDGCVVALLQILLTIKEQQPSRTNSGDLKIIYHLVGLITQIPSVSCHVQGISLQYILCALQASAGHVDKTVSSMLLQRGDFLKLLEKYRDGCSSPNLTDVSLGILAKLMLACDKTTVPAQSVQLKLQKVIKLLNTDRPQGRVGATRLLSAYFCTGCHSQLITTDQPLSSKQLRVIWIYCQQAVLQDGAGLRDEAVSCMKHMVHFLMAVNPSQGSKLLQQPWNRLMVDSLMEEFDGSHVDARTVQLLNMFLRHPQGLCVIHPHHLSRLQDHLSTDPPGNKDGLLLKSLINKALTEKNSKTKVDVKS